MQCTVYIYTVGMKHAVYCIYTYSRDEACSVLWKIFGAGVRKQYGILNIHFKLALLAHSRQIVPCDNGAVARKGWRKCPALTKISSSSWSDETMEAAPFRLCQKDPSKNLKNQDSVFANVKFFRNTSYYGP